MKVLICGPRGCQDVGRVVRELCVLFGAEAPSLVIHGGALGVDAIAGEWAKFRKIPVQSFAAAWKVYGKAAGPIRNRQMLDEAKPDLVVAFQYEGGGTPGTQNMIQQARKANVPVKVIVI